jgi:small subunit ribosomal protein S20
MAITSSAKKAHRASLKKRVFNVRRAKALRETTKDVLGSLQKKDAATAEKNLPAAYKAIDKAAKRGIIKKNAASRKKSRLARAIARTTK